MDELEAIALTRDDWEDVAVCLVHAAGRRNDTGHVTAQRAHELQRAIVQGLSAARSPRRRLLEEVLGERSRTVAFLPPDQAEPAGSSMAWQFGLSRWALGADRQPARRRRRVLECAAICLAWLEAIERERVAEL